MFKSLFLAVGIITAVPSKKFRVLKYVGILGASVSEKLERNLKNRYVYAFDLAISKEKVADRGSVSILRSSRTHTHASIIGNP